MDSITRPCTAFVGVRLLDAGPLIEVAISVKNATDEQSEAVLAFDDATGKVIDFDLRGSKAEFIERLLASAQKPDEESESRGRGRPKLGVVPREVTLLPQHWEWLAKQPGGASVALRKLVHEAMRRLSPADKTRQAREAAYNFMSAMAGDLPGFEEASRCLFKGDESGFAEHSATWPEDVRNYTTRLAFPT